MIASYRIVLRLLLLGGICGAEGAQASGPALPPKESRGAMETHCDFAQAELKYLSRWSPKSGHHASIESLVLKKDRVESSPNRERLDQIGKTYFVGQERIDGVTATCYENRLIIFNVHYSALKTDNGAMRWVAESPLHLTIGSDGISIAQSPTVKDKDLVGNSQ